jgi:hypothetical protein
MMKTKRKLSAKQQRLKDALRTKPAIKVKPVGSLAYTLYVHSHHDTNSTGKEVGTFVGLRDLAREIHRATARELVRLMSLTITAQPARPGQESEYAARPRHHETTRL